MATERTFWCQCWKGPTAKAQPSECIRTMVRVRVRGKSLLLQVDWGWKGVSERDSGVQRKLGRGECLVGVLV